MKSHWSGSVWYGRGLFLVSLLFCLFFVSAVAAQSDPAPSAFSPPIVTNWSADEMSLARASAAEMRGTARLPQSTAVAAPNAADNYADPSSDLLYKWLQPEVGDQGLAVSGGVMRSDLLQQALGLPASFSWRSITFDRTDYDLSIYDIIPSSGYASYNGSATTLNDAMNTSIPAYSDLLQARIQPNGSSARWELTSRGSLPALPESYELGYNNVIRSGSQEWVQFIGATAFTAGNWHWSVRDRGTAFPWWNDDLDVVDVGLVSSGNDIRFSARVDGRLSAVYASDAAWPSFEWYLDLDNNAATGDSFSFGYQEGSYVFNYTLDGVEAVASAVYDPAAGQWRGLMRRKLGPNNWQTTATASPVVSSDQVTIAFTRQEAGVQSTFRWGLLSSFTLERGGQAFFGRVDVAPNSGMKTETVAVDPDLLLAETYLPQLRFALTTDYFPVDIGYMLTHARLCTPQLIGVSCPAGPVSLADLAQHADDGSYLDVIGDKPSEAQTIWQGDTDGQTGIIHARVHRDGNRTALQYYFFYFYNQWGFTKGCDRAGVCPIAGGNNHEGDWEMIQIDLLNGSPVTVTASQHHTRSKRLWSHVEKAGSLHPIVYVGFGSHATYFKDSYFIAQEGGVGLPWWDESTGRHNADLVFQAQLIKDNSPAWIEFKGQWGKDGGGPTGPKEMGRWGSPFEWSDGAAWDEQLHYGRSDLVGSLDWKPSRASKVSIDSNLYEIEVYDEADVLVLSRSTNTLSASREAAEYVSNCTGHSETVLLHKLPGNRAREFDYKFVRIGGCLAARDSEATDEPITITLNLPDATTGQVSLVEFSSVSIPTEGSAWLDLSATTPLVAVDANNDGVIDSTVQPTAMQTEDADFISPARVTDLRFATVDAWAELRWTAPGDAGPTGRPAAYEIRYAEFPVTAETWSFARPLPQGVVPAVPGTEQRLELSELTPGRYFFALRSWDASYNESELSNGVSGTLRSSQFVPLIVWR
jgi:hypothetical protein